MRLFLLTYCFFLWTEIAQAQRPDRKGDFWLFGSSVGMHFKDGGDPVLVDLNKMNTETASSTISDAEGNLQLYSNGTRVWDQSGEIIKNADGLIRTFDPLFPGLIVPIPESNGQFYVFSVDNTFSNPDPNIVTFPIFYTKIDMNANGGKGEKEALESRYFDATSFGMTTVKHCNNVDYWFIIHEGGGDVFLVYLIDKDGIHTESIVESKIGTPFAASSVGLQQEIIASQDGSKIAISKPVNPEDGFLEIFDFDNETGKVTGKVTTIKNLGKIKGVAFSPNASFIYLSRLKENVTIDPNSWRADYELLQFRTIHAPAYKQVITTQSYIGKKGDIPGANFLVDPGTFGNLKLAPNGKIYLAHIDDTYLSVINNPDLEGLAANFTYRGFSLNGRKSKAQLPNTIAADYPELDGEIVFEGDSLICNPFLELVIKDVDPNDITYQWYVNDSLIEGATFKNYKTRKTGDYQAIATAKCLNFKSKIKYILIDLNVPPPASNMTIPYCQESEILPLTVVGTDLRWYDNASLENVVSTAANFQPGIDSNKIGKSTYFVTQEIGGCESSPAEFIIDVIDRQIISIGDSIRFECFENGQTVNIKINEKVNEELNWFFNGTLLSNQTSIDIKEYGVYSVEKVNAFCPSENQIEIKDGCFRIYLANSFSPNGDAINETFLLNGNGSFEFDFEVVNRQGRIIHRIENVFFDNQEYVIWDGKFDAQVLPIGAYFYQLNARREEDGILLEEILTGAVFLLK